MLAALGLVATPAMAVDLATKAFNMTMPNGDVVPMWGFVRDTGGCWAAAGNAARQTCINGLPDPTVPGPRLTVGAATGNIQIRLSNGLPEPVSIVIPGQEMPASTACSAPVWTDGSNGARTAADQRVRSFGCEAAADGGREHYRWRVVDGTQFQPGTYIYQSGTHPQLQVQMGLYGAIRRNDPSGDVYAGVPFDMQRDLFYSEVDPALHSPPTAANTQNYHPKHFLLQRYQNQTTVVDASIDPSNPDCIPTGAFAEGDRMLLRLYNAGLRELAPTMIGSHFDLVAEGGKPYQFASRQYSVLLQPGSTKDVVFTPDYGGRFPIIERRLNTTDPGTTGSVNGGMQTCLVAAGGAGNTAPTADAGPEVAGTAGISVTFDGSGSSDPDGDALSYSWAFGDGNMGSGATPSHAYGAAGSFIAILTVDDGNGGTGTDTATANIVANALPVADPNGPYDVRAIGLPSNQTVMPITFDGTGSSDTEGQPLTYSWDFGDGNGGSGPSPEHTYADDSGSPYTVTLTVNDGFQDSVAATTTATVTQNAQPVAVVTADTPSVSVTLR